MPVPCGSGRVRAYVAVRGHLDARHGTRGQELEQRAARERRADGQPELEGATGVGVRLPRPPRSWVGVAA